MQTHEEAKQQLEAAIGRVADKRPSIDDEPVGKWRWGCEADFNAGCHAVQAKVYEAAKQQLEAAMARMADHNSHY